MGCGAKIIILNAANVQKLANSLWDAGIRPEQSKQSQGAFEAQAGHLEDMRLIAFDRLKIGCKVYAMTKLR